jgi:hypothetical protein
VETRLQERKAAAEMDMWAQCMQCNGSPLFMASHHSVVTGQAATCSAWPSRHDPCLAMYTCCCCLYFLGVSAAVKSQVQSQVMSTKLRNRRAAENKLGVFLEQVVVSEDLISSILDSEVGLASCFQNINVA